AEEAGEVEEGAFPLRGWHGRTGGREVRRRRRAGHVARVSVSGTPGQAREMSASAVRNGRAQRDDRGIEIDVLATASGWLSPSALPIATRSRFANALEGHRWRDWGG